jgi:Protein of unknown function (DUF1264)
MNTVSRCCVMLGLALTGFGLVLAARPSLVPAGPKLTPADGHTIHVVAPHILEGKIMGPFHHYCKPVSDTVLECLIYDSEDPKAILTQVEYFIAKSVTTPNVPLNVWNRFYHDHAIEIAGGRVKVLDATDAEAKRIVDVASKTDGIVFSLWQPEGAKAPLGEVKHPQAVGHVPMTEAQYKDPKR